MHRCNPISLALSITAILKSAQNDQFPLFSLLVSYTSMDKRSAVDNRLYLIKNLPHHALACTTGSSCGLTPEHKDPHAMTVRTSLNWRASHNAPASSTALTTVRWSPQRRKISPYPLRGP